jgi:putative (di)nucleoside polyphosphate hydrolase
MIDQDGFRLNVGMVLVNARKQVFWGQRTGNPSAWQFPQGGLHQGEDEQTAMYRELIEELGLFPEDIEILSKTDEWLYYSLPERYQRTSQKPLCIGQKQKWFLLRLLSDDQKIKLDYSKPAEFEQWRWVDYWLPIHEVIAFKREVYHQVLHQFAALVFIP